MSAAHKARTWLLALGLSAACSQSSGPVPETGPLPEGVAARVADDDISTQMVERVAQEQGISRAEARERLIGDALFAAEARARFRGSGHVETAERSALARALLDSIKAEARAGGPPTDAEVDAIVQERWYEFDRPPLLRTTHAVAIARTKDDEPKAKLVAERILEAVRGATTPEAFTERAKKVSRDGVEVRVESLDPVAPDGRVMETRARPAGVAPLKLDLAYARAAHALTQVGDQSPIVQSPFGFHVILISEKIDELRYSREQCRRLLEHEIIDRRASQLHTALLNRLSTSTQVSRERSADELLGRVKVVDR